jgi:hypothetical protein
VAFIAKQNYPNLTPNQLRNIAYNVILPFQHILVFHKIKFWNLDPHYQFTGHKALNVAHAQPKKMDKHWNKWLPSCSDTVLVKTNDDGANRTGIHSMFKSHSL